MNIEEIKQKADELIKAHENDEPIDVDFGYWDEEVKIFEPETIKELLKTKKANGKCYTKAEIMEAKKEGERLLKLMDILELQNIKQMADKYNKGMSFIEAYNLVDLTKVYNVEAIEDFRKMCSNETEGHILSSLIHLNNYKLQGRDRNEMVIVSGLNYYKSTIKLYDKFNSFHISNECVQKMEEMIDYWSKPKNESKKIRIKIKASMPTKKLEKYNLGVGQVFESQKDLAEYCGITKGMVSTWKKCYYIEEIVERPLTNGEMLAIQKKTIKEGWDNYICKTMNIDSIDEIN